MVLTLWSRPRLFVRACLGRPAAMPGVLGLHVPRVPTLILSRGCASLVGEILPTVAFGTQGKVTRVSQGARGTPGILLWTPGCSSSHTCPIHHTCDGIQCRQGHLDGIERTESSPRAGLTTRAEFGNAPHCGRRGLRAVWPGTPAGRRPEHRSGHGRPANRQLPALALDAVKIRTPSRRPVPSQAGHVCLARPLTDHNGHS